MGLKVCVPIKRRNLLLHFQIGLSSFDEHCKFATDSRFIRYYCRNRKRTQNSVHKKHFGASSAPTICLKKKLVARRVPENILILRTEDCCVHCAYNYQHHPDDGVLVSDGTRRSLFEGKTQYFSVYCTKIPVVEYDGLLSSSSGYRNFLY